MPALKKEDMKKQLEDLAQQLVASGLLRIDADVKQNFVYFSMPTRNVHITVSERELTQENLLPRTRSIIYKALSDAGEEGDLDKKLEDELSKLKLKLKKCVPVEKELEIKLARILVQSVYPSVILMIMLEKVNLFVSYAHNIGDVMDIVSWQQAGTNSGMQSTDGKNVAVFVSCGGDPLLLDYNPPNNNGVEEERTYGDGKPALARMMGIAGQETGHYSDIRHNKFGQQIGRYSANFGGTEANSKVNLARKTDIENINTYWNLLLQAKIERLIDCEQDVQFYYRNPNRGAIYYLNFIWMKIIRWVFILSARNIKFFPMSEVRKNRYLGLSIKSLVSDMLFNLQPKADVYASDDKNVEEAIACIEALARVPQQVNKWGHKNVFFYWRNLYRIYYYKLIPGCINDYEQLSGKKFTLYPSNLHHYSLKEKIKIKIARWRSKL